MTNTNDYVTINEAAEMLSVSDGFIKKCIHRTRLLPAVRVPGSKVIRIRRADVLALMQEV